MQFEANLQEEVLRKKIQSGNVVLFVGAGASALSGAPLGGELSTDLAGAFGVDVPDKSDLFAVCSKILDTPGNDRRDLERQLRRRLGSLQPTAAHAALWRHRWSALFTTNFDDLIELSHRVAKDKVQEQCDTILTANYSRLRGNSETFVPLFKLMGTLLGEESDTQMALSRRDYNRRLQFRTGLFNLLYDFVRDSTVIYIGYSFNDEISRGVLDEIQDLGLVDRLPWSYVVSPSLSQSITDAKSGLKLIHCRATFEEFGAWLTTFGSATSTPVPVHRPMTLALHDCLVEIDERHHRALLKQFEVVHDEIGKPDSEHFDHDSSVTRFFEARDDGWLGVVKGWGFRRAECKDLFSMLDASLDREAGKPERPLILLRGSAGSGKSVVAKLVALEIYRRKGIPVVFANATVARLDLRALDGICRVILGLQLEKLNEEVVKPLVFLFVVDDASKHVDALARLRSFLETRGIRAVTLAVSRSNEWFQACRYEIDGSANAMKVRVVARSEIELPDRLRSEHEVSDLLNHLHSQKLTVPKFDSGGTRRDHFQSKKIWKGTVDSHDRMFWDTLYRVVFPARKPLVASIFDEYDVLTPLARQAYRRTALFSQYGIAIPVELLARSLGSTYEAFLAAAYDPVCIGVLVSATDESGGETFRARSRLVAEHVVTHAYQASDSGSANAKISELQLVVEAVLPNNARECNLLRRLLIGTLGASGEQPIEASLLIQLYHSAFKIGVLDSSLMLHYAITLGNMGDFDAAIDQCRRALTILESASTLEHFRTESRTNVLHSLGVFYTKRALSYLSRAALNSVEPTNGASADKDFRDALACFRSARQVARINSYAYYSEGWLFLERAKRSQGNDALLNVCLGFRALDDALNNLPETETSTWDLQGKLVALVGDLAGSGCNPNQLSDTHADEYAYLSGRLAVSGVAGGDEPQVALALLWAAAEAAAPRGSTVRLMLRLIQDCEPHPVTQMLRLLSVWYSGTSDRELALLFEYAYLCFEVGDYARGYALLDELSTLAEDHPYRSGLRKSLPDLESGIPRFAGIVETGMTLDRGWIKCDALGARTSFFPRGQRHTLTSGLPVRFNLAFNYRGPYGIDVEPA